MAGSYGGYVFNFLRNCQAPMFEAALFTVANIWKQPKCPLAEAWIKMCICIQWNEILPFATTWVDPEGIMLSELSQTNRDKYCMWNLKDKMNDYNKTKTDSDNREQTSGYQRGGKLR